LHKQVARSHSDRAQEDCENVNKSARQEKHARVSSEAVHTPNSNCVPIRVERYE
jgi:hypothetical protein